MEYVDQINMENGGEGTKLYSTGNTRIKKLCLENDLHLLDASVRHLGTDINYVVLEHLYAGLKDRMDIFFDTPVRSVEKLADGYAVTTDKERYEGRTCVISVGRSGQQVDGGGLHGAEDPHQLQPCGYRRAGGAAL